MKIIFFGILFLTCEARATGGLGNSCLELEGLNLGCVSSIDHTCKMNKSVDDVVNCTYVNNPSVMKRVEGPIAFHCKSSRDTTTTVTTCNGNACTTNTVTTSVCVEYQPPECTEECVPCFQTIVTANIGIQRGCIICTRNPDYRCPGEKDVVVACPAYYNGMPNGPPQQCSSDSRCPTTAVDPLGNTQNVIIHPAGNCSPPDLPHPKDPPTPQKCIWKVDPWSGPQKCNVPLDPSNQNF